MNVRSAVAAGGFYPEDPGELAATVDALLDAAPSGGPAAGYLVPHAGYRYSGATAAHAYARLRGSGVRRVVLLGPAHFVLFRGCRLSGEDAWASPLGPVPVDRAGVTALVDQGLATVDDRPHRPEHAIEVQLPFLQRVLGDFTLLPIAVGVSDVDSVARMLVAAAGDGTERTVVIAQQRPVALPGPGHRGRAGRPYPAGDRGARPADQRAGRLRGLRAAGAAQLGPGGGADAAGAAPVGRRGRRTGWSATRPSSSRTTQR